MANSAIIEGWVVVQGVDVSYRYVPSVLTITCAELVCGRSWDIETRGGPRPEDFTDWAQEEDWVAEACLADALYQERTASGD